MLSYFQSFFTLDHIFQKPFRPGAFNDSSRPHLQSQGSGGDTICKVPRLLCAARRWHPTKDGDLQKRLQPAFWLQAATPPCQLEVSPLLLDVSEVWSWGFAWEGLIPAAGLGKKKRAPPAWASHHTPPCKVWGHLVSPTISRQGFEGLPRGSRGAFGHSGDAGETPKPRNQVYQESSSPSTKHTASFSQAGNCSSLGDKRRVKTARERNQAVSLKDVLQAALLLPPNCSVHMGVAPLSSKLGSLTASKHDK